MELKLKNYKLTKIRSLVKTRKILFFFHFTNVNNKIWINLEQDLFKKRIKSYKIDSSLVNFLLNRSIYLNLTSLIGGPLILLYFKSLSHFNYFLNKIFQFTNKLRLFGFIFQKNFYPVKLISSIKTFKFIHTISKLFFFFKQYISVIFLSSLLAGKN
jgi:hypothetical protein